MKPIILLTSRKLTDPLSFGVGEIYSLRSNYCRAVRAAGGIPVLTTAEDAESYAEMAHGILFTGGSNDICPDLYGEENRAANGCDRDCDETELALFHAFYRRNKPILGICRGIQLINVALGGTLHQDLKEEFPALPLHQKVFDKEVDSHPVRAATGSTFARLFGEQFTANSHHHQAVKDCGEGLLPTAVTAEGVIEGVEHRTLPILGVQWHPERMIGEENLHLPDMTPLFRHFVELCKK